MHTYTSQCQGLLSPASGALLFQEPITNQFTPVFQTLNGGLGFLQVAGDPSDGPITIPGVTLDGDSHVSMSHQAPSTVHAPDARAASEFMTAAREEVNISQECNNPFTSSDAESASPPTLSDVMGKAAIHNALQASDTESAESSEMTCKVIPSAPLAEDCCSTPASYFSKSLAC